MRKVAIIGIGQTPVKEHWDKGLRELAVEALADALTDAHITKPDVLFTGNMLSGFLSHQENVGALIADYAGLEGIESIKIEAACASGAAAFRRAVLSVASGVTETAVALGVEKLTENCGFLTSEGLATAADSNYESAMGLSFVALNAILMRRYLYEYKYDKNDFAHLVINAHKNALHNQNAMFHSPVDEQQYIRAKIIADPINLLDSSPIADNFL